MQSRFLGLVVFMLMCGLCVGTGAIPDRVVELHVTVRTPDGAVVPGMAIEGFSSVGRKQPMPMTTNASGECVVPVLVTDDASLVSIAVSRIPLVFVGADESATSRLRSLLNEYCWPIEQRMMVAPGQTTVAVEFKAMERVSIRGKINGVANASTVNVFRTGSDKAAELATDGSFCIVDGFKAKRNSVCIVVGTRLDGLFKVIDLSATQSQTEVNLGDIALPSCATTAPVRLVASDAVTKLGTGARLASGITLVSDDGLTILSYGLNGRTTVNVDGSGAHGAGIPPGGYFVAPADLVVGGGEKLVSVVRAGRAAELTSVGFPHFVAVEGQLTTFTWNIGASWDNLVLLEPD